MISIEYFGILILSVITYWLIPKQSLRNLLLVLSVLASTGFLSFIVGILGEVLKYMRIISENNSYLLRKMMYDKE